MQRGPITAVLAIVFYAALLFWASAWRQPADQPQLVGNQPPPSLEATPAPTASLPSAETTELPSTAAEAVPDNPLAPSEFAAERAADGSWEIDGQLAEQGIADQVLAAFRAADKPVLGEIDVSPDFAPAPWGPALATWIPQHHHALTGSGGLGVFDGQLLIAGTVSSDAERSAFLTAARTHFAATGLEIVGEIDVAAAHMPAEIAIVPNDNGGFQIAGQLGEPDLKERLLAIIADITGGAPVVDNLSVANNTSEAPWGQSLLQILPALLVEVESPQLMASHTGLLIAGTVKTDATRDAMAEMVGQSFATSAIDIDNQLQVVTIAAPSHIAISRSEEGVLTIGGELPDAALATDLLAAARTASPGVAPIENIQTTKDIGPAPWLAQLTELVPAFAESTRWGALSVHGDEVALEAEVDTPEAADVLTALVENAFPKPAFKRVVAISVTAPTGPSDEDIATLERLARDSVIYFASNSDELSPAGRDAAGQLATALLTVPGSGIALLGHADPHGRAAYNRALSKRRCDAVRAVLEAAGIEPLLIETEVLGESDARPTGKTYESARRVEFELR